MRKLLGDENIKKTYSGHPKYYLVESYNNLKALDKYRKSRIVQQAKFKMKGGRKPSVQLTSMILMPFQIYRIKFLKADL